MAGIGLAKKLKEEKKDKGKVIALGKTLYKENYVIIQLEADKGRIYQIDYGGDITLESNINLGDIIELNIVDDYSAKWEVVESGPKQIL